MGGYDSLVYEGHISERVTANEEDMDVKEGLLIRSTWMFGEQFSRWTWVSG